MKRGIFAVFEGNEKGGKKTQSQLLADALTQISGKQVLLIQFPDKSTSVGDLIAKYQDRELDLKPHVAHLLYTANRWERQREISAALDAGIHVVADRYTYSGIVNTAAKLNPLSNADWKWCRSVEAGLIPPDVVFCLVPEDFNELVSREGFGQQRFETASFQRRVLAYYARLSHELEEELNDATDGHGDKATEGEQQPENKKPKLWNWIQATGQTVDEIHNCIMTIIDPLL
ncbi:unnamed protein product [Calicophoron daubneyi]|uniref:Thymidylate kinase-like domain-containing protein n=1 Tax=Calicophoron daubneyi TaxID=300641 RepID=A0AAV2T9X1_CALDB